MDSEDISALAEKIKNRGIKLKSHPKDPDVRAFFDGLSDYASRLLHCQIRDPHEREDVVQEACRKAFEVFDSFDPRKGEYSKLFAHSIVPKTVANYYRVKNAKKRNPSGQRVTYFGDHGGKLVDGRPDHIGNSDNNDFLDAMMREANPLEARALESFLAGDSLTKIAEREECAPTTASNRVLGPGRRLRERMDSMEADVTSSRSV